MFLHKDGPFGVPFGPVPGASEPRSAGPGAALKTRLLFHSHGLFATLLPPTRNGAGRGGGDGMFPKARLDTLSDSIFAVAMTILVLDVRLPDNFHPNDNSEMLQGLFNLCPKALPFILSFGVVGLRWLANIEIRTRAEHVGREYVNWWLLYQLLITCMPLSTIVVGSYGHFAPAIWLYAGHTLLIAAVGLRLTQITPDLEQGDHLDVRQFSGLLLILSSLLAIALSFFHPRLALWALVLNLAAPILRKWSQRRAAAR